MLAHVSRGLRVRTDFMLKAATHTHTVSAHIFPYIQRNVEVTWQNTTSESHLTQLSSFNPPSTGKAGRQIHSRPKRLESATGGEKAAGAVESRIDEPLEESTGTTPGSLQAGGTQSELPKV